MAEFGTEPALRIYLQVVQRRKYWVIGMVLLGLAVSLAISLAQPKEYSATAQLLVQSSNQAVTLGPTQQDVSTTDVQTEQQLATSAPVVSAVRKKLGSAPAVATSQVGQTNVIAVTAVSTEPKRAALVANTYAQAFVAHTRSIAFSNLTAGEAQLRSQISSLTRQIKSLHGNPKGAAEAAALANQEAVLKEEVAQLQVNGAIATGGVEFVTPAQVPVTPSSPQVKREAALGVAAGLLLGLAAAFLRDSLDDALPSKEAAERLTGAPVLGMVPMVASWKKRDQGVIASNSDPTSPAAEAYRSLRTSLQFARQGRDLRTLLVTSPAAAEGKTSTLANLGAVFAEVGERVVLVSADMRRPRLGKFFGLAERWGLTQVLLGQRTLEEALQPVPGYPRLWLLGAGPVPANPAEMLSGSSAHDVFATLREHFDLVLVDSPPVLPVTDAMVLSNYADGILLVAAADQTRSTQLQRTAERIEQAGANLVGVALNQVSKQMGYSSGYSYGSYSGDSPGLGSRVGVNGSGIQPSALGSSGEQAE
jgi:polysaccharide biosynthesis transport protein